MKNLLALIAKRTPEQQQALLAVRSRATLAADMCELRRQEIERTPHNGGSAFWGGSNYPRCKTTMAIRVEAINA